MTDLVRIADATGFTRTQVELIKDTVARGASDDELLMFLHLAKRSALDPFLKQIYLIKRWDSREKREVMTAQTGIDGLRLIADRTERYAPGRAPTFEYAADGDLFSATSYVKKWVRGEWHEVAATAHYEEYVQTKKDGTPTSMWEDKPHIMLAKCAEALALRRAFPADTNRLYIAEEMREDVPALMPPSAPARRALITVDAEPDEGVPPFSGKLSGPVSKVQTAYSSKGELAVRFVCAGQACLVLNTLPELIHLHDNDPVVVKGELRTHKGEEVVLVETMYHADEPGAWKVRASVALHQEYAELDQAVAEVAEAA